MVNIFVSLTLNTDITRYTTNQTRAIRAELVCLVFAIRSVDLITDPKKLVNNGEHLNEVLSRRASIGG